MTSDRDTAMLGLLATVTNILIEEDKDKEHLARNLTKRNDIEMRRWKNGLNFPAS